MLFEAYGNPRGLLFTDKYGKTAPFVGSQIAVELVVVQPCDTGNDTVLDKSIDMLLLYAFGFGQDDL